MVFTMNYFKLIFLLLTPAAVLGISNDDLKKFNGAGDGNAPLEWWQQSVIYQIYPRSFQDSDGDGVGDINGITSRLDYFVDLGIDAIWISPIYTSPMKDFGYDISNFTDIDPIFGSLEDFRTMSLEFKNRGLKLIMDMVPNHSSDRHEWFEKSVQRIDPYTDFYVWRDAKGFSEDGKPIPPSNWVSVFGGPAWEWNDSRQQFYYHHFVKEQPDLNFENILVRNEILAVAKFWLDMGVDGFRVDAVSHLYEDPEMRDEPEDPNRDPAAKEDEYRYWLHPYTYDLPRTLEFLGDIRQLMDIYSAVDGQTRCMMVESGVPVEDVMKYYGTTQKPIAHFPFNFRLLKITEEQNASEVLDHINIWYRLMPQGQWANFVLGNHDQKRVPLRWTHKGIDGANMINLLLQGTAVTYQGEEIGMNNTFLTWEETVDPAACNTDPERYQEFTRDPARTPFQWSNETSAGFSTSPTTWLPLNPDYGAVNLRNQQADEESHFKVYKQLLALRQTEAWKVGAYQSMALSSDKVLAFSRIPPEDSPVRAAGFLVLFNLSADQVTVDATVLDGVPLEGVVRVRSVGFQDSGADIGSSINTARVLLGSRDAIVIELKPGTL